MTFLEQPELVCVDILRREEFLFECLIVHGDVRNKLFMKQGLFPDASFVERGHKQSRVDFSLFEPFNDFLGDHFGDRCPHPFIVHDEPLQKERQQIWRQCRDDTEAQVPLDSSFSLNDDLRDLGYFAESFAGLVDHFPADRSRNHRLVRPLEDPDPQFLLEFSAIRLRVGCVTWHFSAALRKRR